MQRKIAIVGAPLCDGERELGVEKAPIAIRKAGLQKSLERLVEVRDFGDIMLENPIHDTVTGKLRNIRHIAKGGAAVMHGIARVAADGYLPLILGGDCSVFHGSMCALRMIHHEIDALYVDGHADFHTPDTTSSGYFSGMALAASVGRCNTLATLGYTLPSIREEDVCVVGVRKANIDPLELRNLEATNVKVVTIDSLRSNGFENSLEEATESLREPLYLHFDLDVINVKQLPALAGMSAGVHSTGGLTYEEALSLCKALGELPLAGIDITLYDPQPDATGDCARRIVDLITAILS